MFFFDGQREGTVPVQPFKPPGTWMPPKGREQALETYIKAVRSETLHHIRNTNPPRTYDNLPAEERRALKTLRRRDDIVIKPADKGSAVVIQSKEDYLREAHRQFLDTSSYQQLPEHPTISHSLEVKDWSMGSSPEELLTNIPSAS